MNSVRKIGNEVTVSVTQKVVPLWKEAKDTVISFIGRFQSHNSNVQDIWYQNTSFYYQSNDSTYDYNNQPPNYRQHNTVYNLEVTNQPNNHIIDSTYNHKRSNLQKLKAGIKDAFSEKENYAFFVFIAVGTAGTLAYFVPEGLRKFVPSKKLNIIDITVAIGATALIAISVAALAYSVYTNIVHSNVTDPTASSHNAQSLNP